MLKFWQSILIMTVAFIAILLFLLPKRARDIHQSLKLASHYLEDLRAQKYLKCNSDTIFHKRGETGDLVMTALILKGMIAIEKAEHQQQSPRTLALIKKLVAARKNRLWGYGTGFMCTATDSNFVIEPLSSVVNVDTTDSLTALQEFGQQDGFVPQFCDSPHPCSMASESSVDFWCQPDFHTTAHSLFLLDNKKMIPEKDKKKYQKYIENEQLKNGSWLSYWVPNQLYSTFLAVRTLSPQSLSVKKAVHFLLQSQNQDGSWGFGAEKSFSTASGLSALIAAKVNTSGVGNAVKWLIENQNSDGSWPGRDGKVIGYSRKWQTGIDLVLCSDSKKIFSTVMAVSGLSAFQTHRPLQNKVDKTPNASHVYLQQPEQNLLDSTLKKISQFNLRNEPQLSEKYDAIIVGAGLAGLTAAKSLAKHKILILEARPVAGGRVSTVNIYNQPIELGALFGPPPPQLAKENFRITKSNSPVGIYYQKKTTWGSSIANILPHITLPPNVHEEILLLGRGEINYQSMSPHAQAFAASLFNTIFPGAIEQYNPALQALILKTFNLNYLQQGNNLLVQSLLSETTNIVYNSRVTHISSGRMPNVTFYREKKQYHVRAKSVILATGAVQAKALLDKTTLASMQRKFPVYSSFLVVALLYPADILPHFSYLVAHKLKFSTVAHFSGSKFDKIYVYYAGKKALRLKDLPAQTILETTIRQLQMLDIADFQKPQAYLNFFWPSAGPVLDKDYDTGEKLFPVQYGNLILAGDYTNDPFGFGMAAAISSGRRAAEIAEKLLNKSR